MRSLPMDDGYPPEPPRRGPVVAPFVVIGVLIGATLIMEGTGTHVEKGYIYSAMGFSLLVQVLNLRRERTQEKAQARHASEV